MSASLTSQRVRRIPAFLERFHRSSRCSFGPPQGASNAEVAECVQARPITGQTRETACDTCMSPGAPATRSPPWEHSIEEDSGDNRCFPHRLGSSLGRQDGARFVDTPLGWQTHQCSGVESDSPCSEGSPFLHPGQACIDKNKPFFDCVSYNSPGSHKVPEVPPGGTETPVLGLSASGFNQSHLYPRDCKSSSRPPVQDWTPS